MRIRANDIVLEIGSGNNPNPRSTILCDRYIRDNGQRAGEFGIVIDRPMVVADGYHLPFADKAFDYVICSHILEHMENPLAFLKEVARVGKAGYIEVPTALSERIFGWDFHLWYCTKEKGKLVLRKKIEGEKFAGFFHRLIATNIWFRRFFESHESSFYLRYEWAGSISCRVENQVPSAVFLEDLDVTSWTLLKKAYPDRIADFIFYISWIVRRIKKKMRKVVHLMYWKGKTWVKKQEIIQTLLPYVRCIKCFRPLVVDDESKLTCENCRSVYMLYGVMPVMLSPSESKKGY